MSYVYGSLFTEKENFLGFLGWKILPRSFDFLRVFINIGFVTIQYLMSITIKNDN